MCGIVGVLDFNHCWSSEMRCSFVDRLSKAIRSRGPDEHGVWNDDQHGITLAQRRLSIVDISPTGHQPMISASGRYVIVYNGELYNAEDYRNHFYHLRGRSDTEILLEACEHWGVVEACQKFRGMFAFALWDTQTKSLYLSRDRIGVKPLYWGIVDSVIIFSSELKGVQSCPGWNAPISEKALSSFFQLGYVIDPLAIYEGFKKVTPGTVLHLKTPTSTIEHTFWDHAFIAQSSTEQQCSTSEAVQRLEALLLDNVQRRMMCDVPIGSFLSGGIDSGLVTAMMQHIQGAQDGTPVRSYSIGFDIAAYNEAPSAEKVAKHIGTHHKTTYMTGKDALDVLTEARWDEPFADSSQLSTAFVCKQARKDGVIVCLSGDGGDESFAGYVRYHTLQMFASRFSWIPQWMRGIASTLALHLPGIQRYPRIHKGLRALKMCNVSELYREMCSQWPSQGLWQEDLAPVPFPNRELKTPLASMQYWDLFSYLPGDILTKVDRASMAYSLEVRSPFLDQTMIEHGWTLPTHHRIHRGQLKYLLRQLALKWLPKDVTQGKKMGFGVPLAHWLRTDLRDWAEALLTNDALESSGFNAKAIQKLWSAHLEGTSDFAYRLWNTLMLLYWRKIYVTYRNTP